MKKTLFDISNRIFYEVAQLNINEINFRSSDKIKFPIIEKTPKCRVIIPKPRKIHEKLYFNNRINEIIYFDYTISSSVRSF